MKTDIDKILLLSSFWQNTMSISYLESVDILQYREKRERENETTKNVVTSSEAENY